MRRFPWLPIDAVLPDLVAALGAAPSVVLQAPPGAGKTTRVPLALLDAQGLTGRIVMLEPRRLATRAAARRMAELLGERVAETVGYRMRGESVIGPRTRIEVVTEGVLTRLVQQDPTLDGVDVVIFDEYHERSLQADLGLALVLQSQSLLREDLRLLVMSATLDGARIAALLGGHGPPPDATMQSSAASGLTDTSPATSAERTSVPIITSEGRAHPVETRWRGPRPERIEPAVVSAVMHALTHDDGDVLVFLPGTAEIRRVEAALRERLVDDRGVLILPLHGTLPQPAQDAAIRPATAGTRKVVLSTSIAETSLTIEGVRVVVDAGLSRVPRFSPRSGMTRLETVRTSRASADQRRGRAGRLGPGVCYRLWDAHEEPHLAPFTTPEILDADLAPVALELAAAGIADPGELRWLDLPPAASFAQARELLRQLGALAPAARAGRERITPHGERMARLPMHPRLAHMVLMAIPLGLGGAACGLAALLADRDVLRGDSGPPDADVRLRLELLLRDGAAPPGLWVDREGVRRARTEAARLRERAGVREPMRAEQVDDAGLLLAFAYPDRIAQRRTGAGARHLLRNGRGAALPDGSSLAREEYLVAADLDGRDREARIHLAAPLSRDLIERHLADQIETEDVIAWNDEQRAVHAVRRVRLGALVLREATTRDADPAHVSAVLLEAVRRAGLAALPWSDAARSLRARLEFLRISSPDWPDVSDEALVATLDSWLAPHVTGVRRLDDLARLDLAELLRAQLSWDQRVALDDLAPTHITVPSGSRLPIDYSDPASPVLAVRLQELFGLAETPSIARGHVPLTLHLLSPAHRPMQVTRDLAGFWRSSYFDVRRDLRGRYPKHHWPEDPLAAAPTAKAKRRGE